MRSSIESNVTQVRYKDMDIGQLFQRYASDHLLMKSDVATQSRNLTTGRSIKIEDEKLCYLVDGRFSGKWVNLK